MAAVFASSTAGRRGAIRMPVLRRTRVVTPAIAASTTSGSGQGSSGGYGNVPNG